MPLPALRRAPTTWWPLTCLLCGVLAGCAAPQTVRLDQGQVQESLQNLEAYVLNDTRQFKQLLEESGAVYDDPAFQAYLDELMKPLVPAIPEASGYHFQLKIIRDPTINAFTLGDGSIYFNAGLLARLRTSQQLAFVAGHEIGHVMNRDLVYFTHDFHAKTIGVKLADLVVSPALSLFGLGGVGELGLGLAYAASVTGYGREREAAADREGLAAMRTLRYDEREAARVFETFLAEHDRYHRGIEISFLSSHPSNQERLKTVKEAMGPKALDVFAPEPVDEPFLDATEPLRIENAALNIQLSRYYHAVEDLQAILRRSPRHAKARYYLGEAYRHIAADPKKLKSELSRKAWREIAGVADQDQQLYWRTRAREEYQEALALDGAYPDPHRGLGLLMAGSDDAEAALSHFRTYLDLAPEAADRRFVASQIERLTRAPAAAP